MDLVPRPTRGDYLSVPYMTAMVTAPVVDRGPSRLKSWPDKPRHSRREGLVSNYDRSGPAPRHTLHY